MARRRAVRSSRSTTATAPPPTGGAVMHGGARRTTGRFFVLFNDSAMKNSKLATTAMSNVAGYKDVVTSADFAKEGITAATAASSESIYFSRLGVALVSADEAQRQSFMTAAADADSPVMVIEPEYVMEALVESPSGLGLEYIRGYRDSISHLYDQLSGTREALAGEAAAVSFADNAQFTWGLQATKVNSSQSNGSGINVAILDTGFDLEHVDFVGRVIKSKSFIPGETVQDGAGHGTHCTGTACGPQSPPSGVRRYGCAHAANIFIGKVLGNNGSSVAGSVVAGMDWAVTNGCQVISMSLGADVDQISLAYETIGQRALDQGCLIVAAAGNNASRSTGNFGFVGQPANSKTILCVGGIDRFLAMYNRSARSSQITGVGGKVDIVGPAVGVFSSVPGGHDGSFNGTSMATPHVSGIAAMVAQTTGHRGGALWAAVTQLAQSMSPPQQDVGAGLVQAPQ